MLNTNLLPPPEKKILQFEEVYRIIRFFTVAMVVAFLFGSVLLLPSFLPLYVAVAQERQTLELESDAAKKLNIREEIFHLKTITGLLNTFSTQAPATTKFSDTIQKFFGNDSSGIELISLDVRKTGEVNIRGGARTRNDLLGYEKKLRDSGYFQELSVPPSNFVSATNVNFNFQGKLKPF